MRLSFFPSLQLLAVTPGILARAAQHDMAIGWQREDSNVPDGYDWTVYVAKLTGLADRFR
jgi:hypothetical protein